MNRLLSRVGVRAASVGLLVLGIVGGVYLGQNQTTQQQTAETQLVVQATSDEMQLLKKRQGEHAAARAWQRQAEGEAAAKAADQAKTVAEKARKLEKKAIEKKKAAEAEKKAKAASSSSSSGGGGIVVGPVPESCAEYSGHRETGCTLMMAAGFGIDQFPCLDKLWKKESGWNPKAHNSSSGAHGIPQALPGKKMASVGPNWESDAATQIKWGLGYIEGRYGTPCKAWAKSQSSGWY